MKEERREHPKNKSIYKGPTEVRALLILANTLIFFIGNPRIGMLTIYDYIAIVFAAVLFTAFFVLTIKQAAEIAKNEAK